ncbi:amidohydrolase family protein [Psychromarinibacter sp. S121]|uniref:amidohydrolase family protein n=1 Tax=Psychromarinibacter sp. S121 TaxID=3415127 RepID=UPI003C7CB69D
MPHPFTEPKIDCHLHLLDPQRFPYGADTPYRPEGSEIGTLDQMRAVFEANGVTRALLVQPSSGYGTDNRAMLDAIRQSGMDWRGIAVVGPEITHAELASLKQAGVAGVAYNLPFHPKGYYKGFGPVTEMLADLDMVLDIQFEGDGIFEALEVIGASPVRLTIDHCGRPDLSAGRDSAAFKALLKLADRPAETVMKLSGHHKFAPFPWPFEAAAPFVADLLSAYTPDNCVWGSDWPFLRVPERVDYGPLLALAARSLPDDADREKVFRRTAERVFWG